MKAALIGDIHANLPALEVVLADIEGQGIKAIWNAGDFVGYGPFPHEVVKLFRKDETVLSVVGNYDAKVLRYKKKREKWRKKKHPLKYLGFKWAYKQLSKKDRKFLRFLSKEMRIKAGGRRVLLVHGSPESKSEHLTPDTPEERLAELAEIAKADVVVCGHSHLPFVRQAGGVWFINPGSVGRPDDGDPRASYAVLEMSKGVVEVEHHRLDYDVDRVVAALRENDLPEPFAQMFVQGRPLHDVLET